MEPIRPMRIPCGENSAGFASLESGLVYAAPGGQPLPLYLLRPWDNGEKHPLVVFIQGCSWTTPNPGFQLPQLAGLFCRTSRRRSGFSGPMRRNTPLTRSG